LEAAVKDKEIATLDAAAAEVGDVMSAWCGDPSDSTGAACAFGSAACRGADALPATVYSPSPAQGGEVADDGKTGKEVSTLDAVAAEVGDSGCGVDKRREVLVLWSVDLQQLRDVLARMREAGENPFQCDVLNVVAAAACNRFEIGDRRARADVELIVRAIALLHGARTLLVMPTATLQRAATRLRSQITRRMKFDRKAQLAVTATLDCFSTADDDTETLEELLESLLAV
jgi:hypothetical protein